MEELILNPNPEIKPVVFTDPNEDVFNDPDLMEAIDEIPKKLGFKIGEVAEIVGVKPYVLRYWETEFDDLKPKKSGNNQRMFSPHDVKVVLMVKKLLYKDRFSIEGAKKALKKLRSNVRLEVKEKMSHEKHERTIEVMKGLIDNIERMKKLFA
jgi:DNA-binding transcriptional MerR regulator